MAVIFLLHCITSTLIPVRFCNLSRPVRQKPGEINFQDTLEMFNSVFRLVDDLANRGIPRHYDLSKRLRLYGVWDALEAKAADWSTEHPVIWNVGIGPLASFVPTLSRILFEGIEDIYGPYDHIVRVRLTPAVAAGSSSTAHQHGVVIEALVEMARTLQIMLPEESELEELKQRATEESYFAYGALSDYLMIQAFGWSYFYNFDESISDPSVMWDPISDHKNYQSLIFERIRAALQGRKRHLLLVENLHVPVSLDVFLFITGKRPSPFRDRWLISTSSKDICDKSRQTKGASDIDPMQSQLSAEYYHAPAFGDLNQSEWATLIIRAIQDAAGSIHSTLEQQGRGLEFWLKVAMHCLYYAILYHPRQASNNSTVTFDELVRCWVAEDLLFSVRNPMDIPAATVKKQSNCYRSAYEAGMVVIQALEKYSLLPIYSIPTPTCSTSWTATTFASSSQYAITGISKLAEGAPRLKQDDLIDLKKSNKLGWVSFANDDGRHVSWKREMGLFGVSWHVIWYPIVEKEKEKEEQEQKEEEEEDDEEEEEEDDEEEDEEDHKERTMSTLILRGCSNLLGFPFDEVLSSGLLVLDLSYTQIDFLPRNFSQLLNLHLLSLRGCSQLESLCPPPSTSEVETAPLAHLENLEVLDMNGVPLLQITQEDGSNKSNLHFLDLSGSIITTLPSEFFHSMSHLEELILGNCSNLKELPPSMAGLSNLLILHIEGTQITFFPEDVFEAMQRLHTLKLINNILLMSFPRSLSHAKGLKELHIYNCISLWLQVLWELVPGLEDLYIQTWKSLEDIKIQGHPNLRSFSLSGPWIRCLSLCGCSSLRTINFSDDLTALENVDLSGTALEEVPHHLPNLPQLQTLLLFNVPCFKRFPWHQLVRFPMVFYLDHCDDNQLLKMFCKKEICADENQHRPKTTNTAQININDSRMFHSFNIDAAYKLIKDGRFLQCFNVQVKPCSVRGMEPKKKGGKTYTKNQQQSLYPDVHSSEADSIVRMMELQPKERHVEIYANNRYPDGLRHLLSVAKSIFIMDDCFLRCLTELNYIMMSLEECQLMHCHEMKVVFRMLPRGTGKLEHFVRGRIQIPEVFPSLKILQVSNLNNIFCLVEPGILKYSNKLITLKLLKRIHLEHCPRLEKLFPCSLSLPALETLVVLFCSNLKTIFYTQEYYEVAPSPLPNIKRIYLQELPQLQHFHDDVMFQFETPEWAKLFFRGCRSFQRLPILKEYPKSKVEVSAERDWWGRLQWSLPEQSDCYLHVPPPKFASRKKHIIRSYLR